MDWNTILTYILKIAGSAAATLITTFATILFAKLKNKIHDAHVSAYINKVVRAAEQLYPNKGTKTGKQKYQYVVDQVLAKFPKMTNNEYLKSLIEGAVYSLSNETSALTGETSTINTTENKTLSSF